jgi:hypothetical protein
MVATVKTTVAQGLCGVNGQKNVGLAPIARTRRGFLAHAGALAHTVAVRFLIEDFPTPDAQARLVAGSQVTAATPNEAVDFAYWRKKRYFVRRFIHKPGSLLDVGCANGLLLRSLAEWSAWPIVPYGTDDDAQAIAGCTELFPEQRHHFVVAGIHDLDRLGELGLPTGFDLVYWNLWDEIDLHHPEYGEYPEYVWGTVNVEGRLAVGFYGPDPQTINDRILLLEGRFGPATERIDNDSHDDGQQEVMVYWDKLVAVVHDPQASLHDAQGMRFR